MTAHQNKRGVDAWLLVLYGLLMAVGIVVLGIGLVLVIYTKEPNHLTLVGLGVVAVVIPTGLYPVAVALAAAARRDPVGESLEAVLGQLRQISDRLLLSDTAKQIAYRDKDREALRQAIQEDLDKRDFDAASALVDQMIRAYGDRVEAEQFRTQIDVARATRLDQHVGEITSKLDVQLSRHDWDSARSEVNRLERLFPDAPHVPALYSRIDVSRQQHKHNLEHQFLEASARDDVEVAMHLLRELDRYLEEGEAAPFREAARGVITKKRMNLGVQFKIAVHDKDWSAAIRIGQEIIESFPNTKMAEEVRSMKDLLQARATGELVN